jgi:hypothetical protein
MYIYSCLNATYLVLLLCWGTQQRIWLRHHATNLKVTGSNPHKVIVSPPPQIT